ncbi:TCR/Tet family MFS transporter [Oharaeibacter diazotrophicus]|uniref:DHA1 family tetracycline resistance protein-like MFS transporter n=1 Tax=Oharaeibacter diazotrophicus TaxID=1920512 RepID=A0A4R6R9L1_9HYPH|nr:TCR/Tet family MFS transporter [Oharaeibacter diazotrophicus]TDP82662.1 DHA1 family tetracycline resistance protein-like MFS transporter [Oharaeibacter diazotrophicus]BBE72575.1 tetracycline resistance protein, class C [Pleomorphomonas sp. SM30]GLS76607.1 tetracycline resistance MFS efflux pump [Oharaeibacter diazotrophicus]
MADGRARGGLLFVFLTVLLDVVGIGMVIPILPSLIGELTGETVSAAAVDGGWLIFVYAGMQFLFAPVIGNLSDRFGRRPLLLASVATFGLDNLICALAPNLAWLFLGRTLAGISGGSYTTAGAYIADVATPENRAKSFGLMGVAFGVGFVLGPALGGLAGELGPRVPFFAAAALSAVNFAIGWVFLKESLPPERRRPFSLARANPLGALRQMRRHPTILGLGAVIVIYQIAHDANPSVWAYAAKLRFGWSEGEIGLSLAAVGVAMAVVMGGLIGPVVKRFGEWRAALAGLLLAAVGFTGYAFATAGWVMFVFVVPFAFIGLIEPSIRAIAVGRMPEDAQGELQGAIASLKSLTMVLSPILMTRLFAWFTGADAPVYFPGAPFLAASVLLVVGAALLTREKARDAG